MLENLTPRKLTPKNFPSVPVGEAPRGCDKCARLVAYRQQNQDLHPNWFNGAVPSFGDVDPQFLIVGLAPGVQGANRTGRPFTGDYAGDLLYATIEKFGFSTGSYLSSPDDGLKLTNCMITNAVRCVPPQNKPIGDEIKACRSFLADRITSLPRLRIMLALGRIAHEQILRVFELKLSAHPFGHGARHLINDKLVLFDSYHCSRYNTNTRRLTTEMFEDVFQGVRNELES